MHIEISTFGYIGNSVIKQITLKNDNDVSVKITNYGGIITAIKAPDSADNIDNIVCGFDDLDTYLSEEYLGNYPYFGAIIGRNANRIKDGIAEIEGKIYQLAQNDGNNHLHGGNTGFDKRIWNYRIIEHEENIGLELSYLSLDFEENYPGNLQVFCLYTLNNKNELGIEFTAKTDRTTIVNLTNHTYFNLTGRKTNILSHELKLNSSGLTETDQNHIPTGKIIPIKNTPYDFSDFKLFDSTKDILPMGYDNNFIIKGERGILRYAGTLREINSGRVVEIHTTQPGLQVYTGYWIPEMCVAGQKLFGKYSGVALETQHFPDAIHQKHFPSTILKPDEKYYSKTVYTIGKKS